MANSTRTDKQPQLPEKTPPKKRTALKVGAVLLLLGAAGSAGAFHFFKKDPEPAPAVEYNQPDIGQATENVKDAQTKVAKDEQAFQAAKKSFEEIRAEWESAKKGKEDAKAKVESASAEEIAETRKSLEAAEQRFSQLTNELKTAQAALETAANRLKSDEQKKQEAEEKQKQIQGQLAKQETQRKGLLGRWKRKADYGEMELDLKDKDQGVMTIHFDTASSFFVGTKKLEVDIEWKVASDNHLIFDSLRGRPKKAFHFVTVTLKRGTHRDQVLSELQSDSFTTYDVGEEDDIKTWTRIKEATE